MLDHVEPLAAADDRSAWLASALTHARSQALALWHRLDTRPSGGMWLVPDIAASAQVVLADRLFCDLKPEESQGLVRFIRSEQRSDGTWGDRTGQADLSLTALGWWACMQAGDDPLAPAMVAARRAVLAMGGAQRASFEVRMWLALAGAIPWTWLPAVPSELWLLPPAMPLSATRISGWAGEVVTPYHLLCSAPVRLHLVDPTPLVLRGHNQQPIAPRLTRAGLAGDLLQAFDHVIKASRKMPRHYLRNRSLQQAKHHLLQRQQAGGGWFATIPTIFALLALRGLGETSDAPCVQAGLAALRRARGTLPPSEGAADETPIIVQGLHGAPWATKSSLALALADAELAPRHFCSQTLVEGQLSEDGPWQARANALRGGWPLDCGSSRHLDVQSTALVIDALHSHDDSSLLDHALRQSTRRAAQALLAMQELDGSFARFERGEDRVIFAYLPWNDAEHLRIYPPHAAARVYTTALVLRALARLGWEDRDDRIGRALRWLGSEVQARARAWDLPTLAATTQALAAFLPENDPGRRLVESRLRACQREDGSFGSPAHTALALSAMLDANRSRDPVGERREASSLACVQALRAGRWLARWLNRETPKSPPHLVPGLGLCAMQHDVSADVRETLIALRRLAKTPVV